MKQRTTLLLLFIFTSVSSVFAQTIEDKKKMDIQRKSSVETGEQLLNIDPIKPKLPNEVNSKEAITEKLPSPSEIAPAHSSQGRYSFFYDYPMIMRSNPILTDFHKFQQKPIYKRISVIGSGEKTSYLGLGESISLNGAIRWTPSNNLTIDAGGMFSRQFYFASPLFRQDMMGIHTRMQYAFTNNIRLDVWGQYIFPGDGFPFSAYHSLFPHTGVGASISIDLRKNTEVNVGAEYQYDNQSQKWKLESSGRVSIGF